MFMYVILGAALIGMALDFLLNRTNLLDFIQEDQEPSENTEESDDTNSITDDTDMK